MTVNEAADLRIIEGIVQTFYESFDNRAPRIPDGRALRDMFLPDAVIRCLKDGRAEAMSVAEFVDPRLELLRSGRLVDFHEWQTEGRTTILGDVAGHWSTYRKEGELDGEPYVGGGRKLLQLCRLDDRWVVSSLLWTDDA